MTTSRIQTTNRACGCGETANLRTVEMSDRLWREFFEVEGAERPATATACPTCIADWERYASPLTEVKSPARKYAEFPSTLSPEIAALVQHEVSISPAQSTKDRVVWRCLTCGVGRSATDIGAAGSEALSHLRSYEDGIL
jgi:hypothetical protein